MHDPNPYAICCAEAHGFGPCKASATLLAQDQDGMQWFVCDDPAHRLDAALTYPLQDWRKRIAASLEASDAHMRLTGENIELPSIWELDVPDTAPVPRVPRVQPK